MTRFSSKSIALIGVFASLHVALYVLSIDLWRNWSIYLQPLEGILLGPWAGLMTAFTGSIIGRMIKPSDFWMFGIIAEPAGALACGLLIRKQWKPLAALYAIMLLAYFVHPFGTWLPLWTILDIVLGFFLIYPVTKLFKGPFGENVKNLSVAVPIISFVGTVTDSLTRIFMLVPLRLYDLFFPTPEMVYYVFVLGALNSYLEDALVIAISFLVIVPLIIVLQKIPGLRLPLS